MAPSPSYSPSMIEAYEKHVNLPRQYRSSSKPDHTLDYLTALHIHQVSTVPYENLLVHYSKEHTVSLDAQILFDKIVTNGRGRGGYCLEIAVFFNHVLRALGFNSYIVGARGRLIIDGAVQGGYVGW
jgi:arylamine N-acetyltransferase